MSDLKMSLDSNKWQLGWFRDPDYNKWIVGFSDWNVRDGRMVGTPSTYTRALVYANGQTEKDYSVEFEFTLANDKSDIRPILCYHITRLAGYYLVIRPGEKMVAYYTYSELFERYVMEDCDFVPEAEKPYVLRVEVSGNQVILYVDGQKVGSFEANDPCGRYTALTVQQGEGYFRNYKLEACDGEVVFADDFSSDSIPHGNVQVDYSEMEKVTDWIDAVVPGTVQTSLLEAGIIEDPYEPFKGEKMHWTLDQRYFYKTTFTIPEQFRGKRLRLYFKGVDYRAWFFLNGNRLCFHEGMFGGPELDITKLADWTGENELAVCILPCPNPPHSNVRPYILHRWHFNMDIVTSGLWQGVELIADDKMFISDPQVITRKIKADGTAVLDLAVTVSTMVLWPFDVKGKFIVKSPVEGEEPLTAEFQPGFIQGSFRAKATIEVPHAHLWWPNGMGEQFLYNVDVVVDLYEYQKQPTPTAHEELHLRTGIRTLRLAPMPDGTDKLTQPFDEALTNNNPLGFMNWCFTVNGKPFFAKGSNWMPMDQMLRLDRDHYDRLLQRVVDSNMNILRPWGAGLLETDDFYDLCDEKGILVWQETLFANGIYNLSKIDVWRETMRRNVCRLRNHPSLAVYCGGNEFDPDLPENKDIIDEIIAICAELDPTREFRPACPYGGDNHSYLVNWMGGQPYTFYTREYSPAITEFSLASPPSMDTLRRLLPEETIENFPPDLVDCIDRFPDYKTWGRPAERKESAYSVLDAHLSGIDLIMFPPMSECGIPKTMEEFVTYLQTAHGLLTQFGIDCWRSRWPYCGAAMSWVFNVIFPDTMSWSYVDYFECPKHSYFYQKRSYEPLHVTAIFDELFNVPGSILSIRTSVANETDKAYKEAKIRVRLYNSRFKTLTEESKTVGIRANDTRATGFFEYEIPEEAKDEVMILVADLTDAEGNLLSRSVYCPRVGTPQARMPYLAQGPWISDVKKTETALAATWTREEDRILVDVENTGEHPAFEVLLHAPDQDHELRYSDNCFFLEAKEHRTIEIKTFNELPEALEISAWNAPIIKIGG